MSVSYANPTAKGSFTDHIFCLRTRNSQEIQFSRPHRWSIFVIGVLETFVFSGCIFGWGPLVYILKNEQIFLNLCFNSTNSNSSSLVHNITESELLGCEAQDEVFALIFTLTIFVYSIPSVLCGLILHYWGLAISRIGGSLLVILGFLALSVTTREESQWLYVAMTLVALGAVQLRFSAFQFCDLFPQYRSTALSIISGCYSASAGLFIVLQIGQENGLRLWMISYILAFFGIFTLVATVIMPWHHVPYENASSQVQRSAIPLMQSLISWSSFLHCFYLMINISGIIFYNINFNSWISSISESNEEAGYYTLVYSILSFGCLFFTPLPGILFDYLVLKASKASTLEDKLLEELKCPTVPLMLVTALNIALQGCFFSRSAAAIYASTSIMTIVRPAVLAVGNATLRIRFPAEHFDRLMGLYSSIIACVFIVQYPFFIFVQNHFILAMSTFIALILSTSIYPLHYQLKSYRMKLVKEKMELSTKTNTLMANDTKI